MITYLELLELIKDGNPPKKVRYGKTFYEWKLYSCNGYNYMDYDDRFLSDCIIMDSFDEDLVSEDVIEVIEE